MAELIIRPVENGDVQAIAALSGELGYPSTDGATAGRLRDLLESPDDSAFVAIDEGDRIIGWIHVLRSRSLVSPAFAQIGGLVVAERAQGRGVGRALVDAAESWARDRGLGQIRVRSNVAREGAHDFYRRLGYEVTKTQRSFRKELEPG